MPSHGDYYFQCDRRSLINDRLDTVFQELLAMQIQYDEETDHCKIKDEQLRWTNFVNDELNLLLPRF